MEIKLFQHQMDFIGSEATHTAIVGGFGCFLKDQKVIKGNGHLLPIQNIKKGDLVKSYNLKNNKVEQKKVLNTFKYKCDGYFKIKLKSGLEINVTKDHKFLQGKAWISIEKILSLHTEIQEVGIKKII